MNYNPYIYGGCSGFEDSDINNCFDGTFPLMQYAGLKDKHGKEIWEGDVVKYLESGGFSCEEEGWEERGGAERMAVVRFIDGQFWPRAHLHSCEDGFYSWRLFNFEVVGNIYENPELLQP